MTRVEYSLPHELIAIGDNGEGDAQVFKIQENCGIAPPYAGLITKPDNLYWQLGILAKWQ